MYDVDALLMLTDHRTGWDDRERRIFARLQRRWRRRSLWLVLLFLVVAGVVANASPLPGTSLFTSLWNRWWLLLVLCESILVPWWIWQIVRPRYAQDVIRARRTLRRHDWDKQPHLIWRVMRAWQFVFCNMRAGGALLVPALSVPFFLMLASYMVWPGGPPIDDYAWVGWFALVFICIGRLWWIVYRRMPERYRNHQCIACGYQFPRSSRAENIPTTRCSECGTLRRVEQVVSQLTASQT